MSRPDKPADSLPAPFHCTPTSFFTLLMLLRHLYLWAVLVSAGLLPVDSCAQSTDPRILVINSYHPGYNWSDAEMNGFSRYMTGRLPAASFSYEFLDWQRYPDPARNPFLVYQLKSKYSGLHKPTLIVTLDDPALDFVLAHRRELGAQETPIVFGGINRLDPALRERHRLLTGLGESINIQQNLDLILKLLPETKTVYAVHDQTRSSLLNRKILEEIAPKYAGRLRIVFLTDWTVESLLSQLSQLPPDSAVLTMGISLDRDNRVMPVTPRFLRDLREKTSAPVFRLGVPLTPSLSETELEAVEWGAIGGYMASGIEHGSAIAQIAIDVLSGTPPDSIPFSQVDRGALLLDYRDLQRFHIPMNRVPPEAKLFFTPVRAYTFSRTQVWLVLGGFALLAAMVGYLILNNLARRRAEAKLREFAAAIEQGSEIILFLTPEGVMTYVNPATSQLTGYSPAEMTGQPLGFCAHDPAYKLSFAPMAEECRRHGSWQGHLEYKTRTGTVVHIRALVTPIKNPRGVVTGYVMMGRDTTLEDKLQEQVRLSQKMEAIGLLAGGVAHDFNNLLQVILGCTQDALDDAVPAGERKAALQLTLGASQRAAELTRQLLLFGRRQSIKAVDVDLGSLVHELVKMIKRLIGEHLTIEISVAPELGNTRGDRSQIEQVIMNLCLNARDAMPAGGLLRIELNNIHFNDTFCATHPWARPGDYVQLIVSDTGTGMDKATAARVFDPFFSTKTKDKGTGLGLSVVYGIVQSHRGMITVYSEPGAGTAMKTYWPIVALEKSVTPLPLPQSTDRATKGTVLLAEDEEAVRNYASKLLSRAGYNVIEARDGQEAVELFAQRKTEVQVVILDAVMPRLSGAEAKRRIRQIEPNVPVLFCSGYSMDALQDDTARPCDLGLLAKPYEGKDLLGRLQNALNR